MSMVFPAIYTTNVDENAVELCHVKHGRPLSVVRTLDDLRSVIPGETCALKCHRSLERHGTILFIYYFQ
jgi:hypothetical protein